jgi:large subunit ribosomal protein L44e
VSLYKRGKESAMKRGTIRHEKEKKGYGGQKFPEQKRKAKTTKKQTLKYTCKECGHTIQKKGMRLRRLTIER